MLLCIYVLVCIERERERERDVIVMRLSRLIFLDLDLSISTLGAVTACFGQSDGISLYIHTYMYIFDATSRYLVPDNGVPFRLWFRASASDLVHLCTR